MSKIDETKEQEPNEDVGFVCPLCNNSDIEIHAATSNDPRDCDICDIQIEGNYGKCLKHHTFPNNENDAHKNTYLDGHADFHLSCPAPPTKQITTKISNITFIGQSNSQSITASLNKNIIEAPLIDNKVDEYPENQVKIDPKSRF